MSVSEFMALTTAVTGFMGSVFGVLALRKVWLRVLLGIVSLVFAGAVVVLAIPAYMERWMWMLTAWLTASVIAVTLWFFGTKYRDPRAREAREQRRDRMVAGEPVRSGSARGKSAQGKSTNGKSARGGSARGGSGPGESGRGESARGESGRGESGRSESARGGSGRSESGRGGSGRRDATGRRGGPARRDTAAGDSARRDLHPELGEPPLPERSPGQTPTQDRFRDHPR